MLKIKNKKNIIILTLLSLLIMGVIIINHINNMNYQEILDTTRATIIGNVKRYNIDVYYEKPDWYSQYRRLEIDNFLEFQDECITEEVTSIYNINEVMFYALLPDQNLILSYRINIVSYREGITIFNQYRWANY